MRHSAKVEDRQKKNDIQNIEDDDGTDTMRRFRQVPKYGRWHSPKLCSYKPMEELEAIEPEITKTLYAAWAWLTPQHKWGQRKQYFIWGEGC